jgi:solute carrier family 35 protein E1
LFFKKVENKKLLNMIPAPLSVATIQFFIGALYAGAMWLVKLRPTPKLTRKGMSALAKVGFYHSTGQLATMISMNVGPISFTHIVKALEPFFSAVVSAVVFGEWMKPQVYATLIPVVGGVAYACAQEKHFSWLSFTTAMSSNLAFALRAVYSKHAMSSNSDMKDLSSTNLFGVVTWFAALVSLPIALFLEGTSFIPLWKAAVETSGKTVRQLIYAVVISGLVHYLNNEVMYLALSNVHPVTLAVGNTMKRVFILVASVMVFQNSISVQAAIGSAIGIGGVLLYSITKDYYEKVIKLQEASA